MEKRGTQTYQACFECGKFLNIKSLKAHMRNVHKNLKRKNENDFVKPTEKRIPHERNIDDK